MAQAWLKALSVKRGAGGFRLMYDLHRSVGLVGGVLLMITAFTGAVMNLPAVARPMVSSISPLTPPKSSISSGDTRIDWQQALDSAQASMPQATPWRIARDDKHGLYQIRLRKPNDLQDCGSVRVFVDACDGHVLHALDPLKGSAGYTLIRVQFGLYSCQLLGMPGKILVALLGLLPLLFTITGIVIWLQKRKSEKVVRNRRLHQARVLTSGAGFVCAPLPESGINGSAGCFRTRRNGCLAAVDCFLRDRQTPPIP